MAYIQTVRGRIDPEALGVTLSHEHVLVDFGEGGGTRRWDRAEVIAAVTPWLLAARERGVRTVVECTPNYLGRDVRLLVALSEGTGMHLLTNTGLYKEPHLPPGLLALAPEALAARWIAEWEDGIDGTSVRPGFIKIAVNKGPLVPVQRLIVRAAALTQQATGLTVACHTSDAVSAHEALDIVESARMDPGRFIVVHAQNMPSEGEQDALAARGCWLSYDNIGGAPALDAYARLILHALDKGLLGRILISHDAGWYHVGEPGGGVLRPITVILDEFLPLLRRLGMDGALEQTLLVDNPRRAFEIA